MYSLQLSLLLATVVVSVRAGADVVHAVVATVVVVVREGADVVPAVAATVFSNGVLCGTICDVVTVATSAVTLRCRHTVRDESSKRLGRAT